MLSSEDAKKDPESKREVNRPSPNQSSKRHEIGSKESPSRRKSKKQLKKSTDDSNRSKRQQPKNNDSTDGAGSGRQKNNNNNDSLDKLSGELIPSTRAGKRSAESTDRRSSRRERPRSAEKIIESKLQKVKRILSGEKIDAPPKDNHICSETFGYGPDFLDTWLHDPETVELKVEPPKKVPVLKVSKTLIIYEVPNDLSSQIEIGDILYKFNDLPLTTRDEYTRQLSFTMKNPKSQILTFTILRPIRSLQIPEKELSSTFQQLQQPQGFEIIPTHFDYLTVFLTIAPKTTLGVTIKGYNGKVYVSGIEKSLNSIAYKCLLVGDAILAIEDQAISGVKDTDDMLCTSVSKKKFVRLIIERAKTQAGLRNVKLALSVEKTFELNPRMTEDVTDICERQIKYMSKHPDQKPDRRILQKSHPVKASTSHVDVASESSELPIATDVNNLQLLAPTPPVPAVPPGTMGSFNPLESAFKKRIKKEILK